MLVVVVLSLVVHSSCARDCVLMTRDMLRIMAQENLMCSSRPTRWRLVAERRTSRRTAETAQQVVRTCPAGVDLEEIG